MPRISRLLARRSFQKWAARFPLTRGMVRREGEALFDVVAGFCHSQVLMALVQLDIPSRLLDGPMGLKQLAHGAQMPEARMEVLLRAGVALGLLKLKRNTRFALTRRGAALAGVPGLQEMIRHHDILYRDLADPVAFFRGETTPELAGFWPYVFGGDVAPEVAETYSDLMAQSQLMVADDTLDAVSLKGVKHLMDVGGGTGAFLAEAGARWPDLQMTLFDLPGVVGPAEARFAHSEMSARARVVPGSFRTDSLPVGADAISLVRVLYDHSDETVLGLLRKCHDALPDGGRLIISEPMAGDCMPQRAGDAYFALYTLAMGTGKTRTPHQISDMCRAAGFKPFGKARGARRYITTCLTVERS